MKKTTLLTVLLLLAIISFSQKITRGPDIGEIYFLGPTATNVLYGAIYHSTDFGETAVCVDSISALSNTIEAITADKTPGGLYFVTMGEALYYSGDYGQYGSWELQSGGVLNRISSGRNEGEIYNRIVSHSIDYGLSFTSHSCQGFFGSTKAVDIDVSNNIGYCISKKYNINDTLFFFNSFNNFDDLEVVKKFNFYGLDYIDISRENNEGKIFLCNQSSKELFFSSNYGVDWLLENCLTCPNLPISGISGGRQDGEIYLLVEYLQMMGQRRHIYIYHSLDYGETFEVFHPVAIGPDPVYANFIAEDTLVKPGDTVQFTDLSNDAETWEWDFDNDGTIDSYEQNPTYIYQDTGYYTVKLTITGEAVEDYGIRYDYIHVDDLTSVSNSLRTECSIKVYPVPTNGNLTIETKNDLLRISIYNSKGELIRTYSYINSNLQKKVLSLSTSDFDNGVYFIKVKTSKDSQTKKIIINR